MEIHPVSNRIMEYCIKVDKLNYTNVEPDTSKRTVFTVAFMRYSNANETNLGCYNSERVVTQRVMSGSSTRPAAKSS